MEDFSLVKNIDNLHQSNSFIDVDVKIIEIIKTNNEKYNILINEEVIQNKLFSYILYKYPNITNLTFNYLNKSREIDYINKLKYLETLTINNIDNNILTLESESIKNINIFNSKNNNIINLKQIINLTNLTVQFSHIDKILLNDKLKIFSIINSNINNFDINNYKNIEFLLIDGSNIDNTKYLNKPIEISNLTNLESLNILNIRNKAINLINLSNLKYLEIDTLDVYFKNTQYLKDIYIKNESFLRNLTNKKILYFICYSDNLYITNTYYSLPEDKYYGRTFQTLEEKINAKNKCPKCGNNVYNKINIHYKFNRNNLYRYHIYSTCC